MEVAVVGTGSIGKRHLSLLLQRDGCNPFAVSEHSKKRSLEVGQHKVPVVNNYSQALEKADVVFIANPSAMHFEYLRDAIVAGKHVYLEKPIGLDPHGFSDLVKQAKQKKLCVAVGTQFRFNPLLKRLKEIVDSGKLGRILNVYAFSGEHIADYHPEEDYKSSYAAREELGGGVLLTQIHQVDYLSWLFGPFSSVSATSVDIPQLDIDVESSVSYFLSGMGGAPVTAHLNYVQRPKRTGLEIICVDGRAVWSYEESTLTLYSAEKRSPEVIEVSFDREQMFADCHQDFFEAIRQSRSPRANLEDGLTALQIVCAIKQSIASQQRVLLT